jgi:hypothetical protein
MQLRLVFPSSTNEELFKDQFERMGFELEDLKVENERMFIDCNFVSDSQLDDIRESAEDLGAIITFM